MTAARIHQLNVSGGGVPKRPVPEVEVGPDGLAGDRQAKPGIHGGPYRAVSLLAREVIDALRREGHPIGPGSAGENVTVEGLDWSAIGPGTRLRLGGEVLIEVTSYAAPCQTIRASFQDGNVNRLNRERAPGRSRVYARVVEGGTLRAGDPVGIELGACAESAPISAGDGIRGVFQVSVCVSDLERAIAFYRDRLGARLLFTIDPPGLAMLEADGVRLMLDGPGHSETEKPGGTTIYFRVDDIDASYRAMCLRGVEFDVAPLRQYENDHAEGWMAFFRDLDGNRLALVSEIAREP